jgi:hypothetical protein
MKLMRRRDVSLIVTALMLGIITGYLDQHTDDTGIIALLVFGFSLVLGIVRPHLAWLWALIIGSAIPAAGFLALMRTSPPWPNDVPGSFLALVFSFVGAYAGVLARRAVTPSAEDERKGGGPGDTRPTRGERT